MFLRQQTTCTASPIADADLSNGPFVRSGSKDPKLEFDSHRPDLAATLNNRSAARDCCMTGLLSLMLQGSLECLEFLGPEREERSRHLGQA